MTNDTNGSFTIGIVVPYLKSRGTEKQALALAKGFLNKKARVILFVVQGWGLGHMYEAFSSASIEVVNVGSAIDVNQKRVNSKRVFKLARLAQKHRCNVLLSRAGMTNQICGFAAILARIPSVVVASSAVSSSRVPSNNSINELLATLRWQPRFGFPSHVVTVSSEGGKKLTSAYPRLAHQVSSINNGVDLKAVRLLSEQETSATTPDDRFNLCYAGSVELRRKGLDTLIGALDLLINKYAQKDIFLNVIGTGEDQKKVVELIENYRLAPYVTFVGEIKNPFTIIGEADVFVLASRREGLPNALLEAMSLGVCAISTDCNTGPREIIESEVNGLLVPVEDSKEMAAAILRVKQDQSLKERLAQRGHQTIKESFSYQGMVDAYYNLLLQLASASSKKRSHKTVHRK